MLRVGEDVFVAMAVPDVHGHWSLTAVSRQNYETCFQKPGIPYLGRNLPPFILGCGIVVDSREPATCRRAHSDPKLAISISCLESMLDNTGVSRSLQLPEEEGSSAKGQESRKNSLTRYLISFSFGRGGRFCGSGIALTNSSLSRAAT